MGYWNGDGELVLDKEFTDDDDMEDSELDEEEYDSNREDCDANDYPDADDGDGDDDDGEIGMDFGMGTGTGAGTMGIGAEDCSDDSDYGDEIDFRNRPIGKHMTQHCFGSPYHSDNEDADYRGNMFAATPSHRWGGDENYVTEVYDSFEDD